MKATEMNIDQVQHADYYTNVDYGRAEHKNLTLTNNKVKQKRVEGIANAMKANKEIGNDAALDNLLNDALKLYGIAL